MEIKDAVALLIIFLLAFTLRIYSAEIIHWWDETVYLQHAEIFAGLRENNFSEFQLRPPLLSMIFAAGFLVWHNPIMASLIVSLLGAFGVIGIYLLGKKMFNPLTGLLAAFFLALSPFIVHESRTLLTDVPALTLITFAIFLMIEYAEKKSSVTGITSGLILGLSVLMRFAILPLLALLGIIYLALERKTENFPQINDWKPVALGFAIPMLPYLAWAQISLGGFYMPFLNALNAVSQFNETPFFYFTGLQTVYPLIVLVGLAVSLLTRSRKKFCWQTYFLGAWLIAALAMISFSPHKESRYLITTVSIPVLLLSSHGLWGIFEKLSYRHAKFKPVAMVIFAVLTLFSLYPSFYVLGGTPINHNFITKEYLAAQFIKNQNYPNGTVVYANDNWPVFAYYTGLKTIPINTKKEEYFSELQENLQSGSVFFLYDSSLAENVHVDLAKFELLQEFDELKVYLYKN